MSVTYIICFVLLGIAGVANIVALVFLFLSLMSDLGGNKYELNSSNRAYAIFVRESKTNINRDSIGLNGGEGREQNKM